MADLTPRERDVFRLMMHDKRTKEIAEQFGISPRTVEHHIAHIIKKLGTRSRVQMALLAIKEGILEVPS